MTTPDADPYRHTASSAVPPVDDEPRRDGLGKLVLGVLVVLLVVMVVQTVYVLGYGTQLRRQQDALICQAKQTQQLRDAAATERQAQRDLLTTMLSVDQSKTQAQREQEGAIAVRRYLASLQESDAERAAVPPCPPLEQLPQGLADLLR